MSALSELYTLPSEHLDFRDTIRAIAQQRIGAKIDRGDPDIGKYSAMAKLFCSDVAMKVTVEAVQVLSGYGYVKEYPWSG